MSLEAQSNPTYSVSRFPQRYFSVQSYSVAHVVLNVFQVGHCLGMANMDFIFLLPKELVSTDHIHKIMHKIKHKTLSL